MAFESAKAVGKNGLPGIITSVLCGYAITWIPKILPDGDLRSWAYSSIPFFSLCILFIIRVLRDIGTLSISEIVFLKFVSAPEKRKLKAQIDDTYSPQDVRDDASKRYGEVCRKELDMVQRKLNYFSGYLKKTPTSPELPTRSPNE